MTPKGRKFVEAKFSIFYLPKKKLFFVNKKSLNLAFLQLDIPKTYSFLYSRNFSKSTNFSGNLVIERLSRLPPIDFSRQFNGRFAAF